MLFVGHDLSFSYENMENLINIQPTVWMTTPEIMNQALCPKQLARKRNDIGNKCILVQILHFSSDFTLSHISAVFKNVD